VSFIWKFNSDIIPTEARGPIKIQVISVGKDVPLSFDIIR